MKKLLLTATLFLIMTIAGFAQTPKDIKVVIWDDSTAYSNSFEIDWSEAPVGVFIPSATATLAQTYTLQYYNPVDATWYELEIAGSAFSIAVTSGRNTVVPMTHTNFLGSSAKMRFRAGTVGAPTTINALPKLYVIYRSF